MQKFLLGVAIAIGGLITYVNARPDFGDTAVTAVVLLVIAGVFGFLRPKFWWLFALALGIWIPILGFFRTQNLFTLLALVVAFVGAYGGSALRTRLTSLKK